MIRIKQNECKDFISFIDPDTEEKKEWLVKLINDGSIGNFVVFETQEGNIYSIPPNRVLKIKKRGEIKND